MKINYPMDRFIVLLRDMVSDVDMMMSREIKEKEVLKWKDRAVQKLSRMLGENHSYVANFGAIEYSAPSIEGLDEIITEESFMLGLDDARSFLAALLDEVESECNQAPGLMDMESLFAEMTRYVTVNVDDPLVKESINHRIIRLRDGMLAGSISSDEIQGHVTQIGYLDNGLFERLVPLLAWYYIHNDEVAVYSN